MKGVRGTHTVKVKTKSVVLAQRQHEDDAQYEDVAQYEYEAQHQHEDDALYEAQRQHEDVAQYEAQQQRKEFADMEARLQALTEPQSSKFADVEARPEALGEPQSRKPLTPGRAPLAIQAVASPQLAEDLAAKIPQMPGLVMKVKRPAEFKELPGLVRAGYQLPVWRPVRAYLEDRRAASAAGKAEADGQRLQPPTPISVTAGQAEADGQRPQPSKPSSVTRRRSESAKRRSKSTRRRSKTRRRRSKSRRRRSKSTRRRSKSTRRRSESTKRRSKSRRRRNKNKKRRSKSTGQRPSQAAEVAAPGNGSGSRLRTPPRPPTRHQPCPPPYAPWEQPPVQTRQMWW